MLGPTGSFIGDYESSIVKWIYPCNSETRRGKLPVFYAVLDLDLSYYPVILKKNSRGTKDQVLVDELKDLFGIRKMGTYYLKIKMAIIKHDPSQPWVVNNQPNIAFEEKWTNYFIFEPQAGIDKDMITFMENIPLSRLDWLPKFGSKEQITENHRKFFFDVQKVILFRELFNISGTSLDNILIRTNNGCPYPLSVDETTVNPPWKKPKGMSEKQRKFFFPKEGITNLVITRALGLSKDRYLEQIENLRQDMYLIINRIDKTKIWLVDSIIGKVANMASSFFEITYFPDVSPKNENI
jgi:hypothetical protein